MPGKVLPSTKDTTSLSRYTPASLLEPGQIEGKLFQNLYTQTAFYNLDRIKTNDSEKKSWYTANLQLLYGLNEKVNVGLAANFKSVAFNGLSDSPLDVFQFENSNSSRAVLSSIGPQIKFMPIKKVKNLSVLSTLYIPVANDLESHPFVSHQSIDWYTQVFYDLILEEHVRLFFEVDALYELDTDWLLRENEFSSPIKAFATYFYDQSFALYGMAEWNAKYGDSAYGTFFHTWFLQAGVGGKLQLSKLFELEVLYTNFVAGKNAGAGETFNVGLRFLKQ